MATASHRHTRRRGHFESHLAAYRPRKGRWIKRLVIGFTLLTIVMLLAPTIIGYTGLRSAPLRLALHGIKGTVRAGGASLSWLGPIVYTDVEIHDANGELLLALPKVESERSLFELVTNLNDLGVFRIERPQVSLKFRRDGSNVEDVLLPWLNKSSSKPASSTSSPPPAVTVQLVDGQIDILDAESKQTWRVEKFNFKLRMSPESSLPAEVALSCELPTGRQTTHISIDGTPNAAGQLDQLQAQIDTLPLGLLRPLAERFAPGLQLSGTLSAGLQVDGVATLPEGRLQLEGLLTADDLAASGGPLAGDRFVLRRVEIPCKLSAHGEQIDVENLALICDVGQMAVAGSLTLPSQWNEVAIAKLARSSLNAKGEVDLAKVAALLPTTLRVREGTQITSGVVQVAIQSAAGAEGQQLTANLNARDFSAIHEGKRLAWNEPIQVDLAANERAAGWNLDRLAAQSSFLQLAGSGSLNHGQAQIHCDLDRLTADVSQFFDLGGARLSGRAAGNLKWDREPNGTFHAAADAQLQALQIAMPGAPVWQEDSVAISTAAAGVIENAQAGSTSSPGLRSLESAQVKITVENLTNRTREQVEMWLSQPVANASPSARWPIAARVQGDVGRWWPRLAPWLEMNDLELAGVCDVGLQATCSSQAIEVQQIQGVVSKLHAWGWNTLFIDEPEARLEGSANYEFGPGRLTFGRTALLTSSLSLQTESATIAIPAAGPLSMQGNLAYQANLARLARWVTDPRTPSSYGLSGILSGTASVAHSASGTSGRIDAVINDFVAAVAQTQTKKKGGGASTLQPVWTEKKLSLALDGGLSQATDTLQLKSLAVASEALALQAGGRIDGLSARPKVDLSGTIDYDWKSLGPLLQPYLGTGVKIVGKQSRKFAVSGSLGETAIDQLASASLTSARSSKSAPAADDYAFLQPLTADLSLGWTRADMYGIRVGPVDLDTHLENGTITTRPIEAALGKAGAAGTLSASPVIRLTPGPAELILGRGMLASNVEISQELSNAWLKFVAPLLAEATRVEGEFSLDLDGARVPLDDPAKADVGGRLIVHNVSVTPGPLGQPLLLIGKQVEALVKKRPPPLDLSRESVLVKLDDQKVDFHMVEGRVYHQGLAMQVGDVLIRTRGWVGVDESLGIVAEVPLKPDWIQRTPALAALRDDVLRIPIEGTLSRPKIDKRAIEQLAGQAIQNTARGLIEGELNKQLDRLLPFQQPQQR